MVFIPYLVIVNIIAFGMMGYDKQLAKAHKRRIPEARLFLYATVGGALGAWLGMRAFRHKTKHPTFVYGIPALFVFNAVVFYFLLRM